MHSRHVDNLLYPKLSVIFFSFLGSLQHKIATVNQSFILDRARPLLQRALPWDIMKVIGLFWRGIKAKNLAQMPKQSHRGNGLHG